MFCNQHGKPTLFLNVYLWYDVWYTTKSDLKIICTTNGNQNFQTNLHSYSETISLQWYIIYELPIRWQIGLFIALSISISCQLRWQILINITDIWYNHLCIKLHPCLVECLHNLISSAWGQVTETERFVFKQAQWFSDSGDQLIIIWQKSLLNI